MNCLIIKREDEKGWKLIKKTQMQDGKWEKYHLQKWNRRAIQLRRRKRKLYMQNWCNAFRIKKEIHKKCQYTENKMYVESMHRIWIKEMKTEKERGMPCIEMKQYRGRIKKLWQKCHAHKIDECCSKEEGGRRGRACTELN